jgi:UDP-glucuronate 4-epimerase
MAHAYSHLFNLPTTGLRFFTVYGPWGRPDMAFFIFTKAILAGKPIQVFNHGNMIRDFTYINDIVEGISRVLQHIPGGNPSWDGKHPNPATSLAPYRLYNIGNNSAVKLLDFIGAIEKELNKQAIKEFMPIQPGDMPITYANVTDLVQDLDYKPSTSIQDGIREFIKWYKEYYKIHA